MVKNDGWDAGKWHGMPRQCFVPFHRVSGRNRNNKLAPDYAREQANNYFTFLLFLH